jgi:hypothetical protein
MRAFREGSSRAEEESQQAKRWTTVQAVYAAAPAAGTLNLQQLLHLVSDRILQQRLLRHRWEALQQLRTHARLSVLTSELWILLHV